MGIYYTAAILILIVYLPIYIFAFVSRKFKQKFMKVHSKTLKQKLLEVFVGVLYFVMIVYSVFLDVLRTSDLYVVGMFLYILSIFITFFGYLSFFVTPANSLTKTFPYNFSRNPTYFYGLVCVFGVSLMTQSVFLFLLVVVQFFLTHEIILIEEKYCLRKYKKDYEHYLKRVRRYI